MESATAGALHEWVQPLIQLVTAGGFGALVWYLVVKHIPAIEARHKEERLEWMNYIAKRDEKLEDLTKEFMEATHEYQATTDRLKDKIEDLEHTVRTLK